MASEPKKADGKRKRKMNLKINTTGIGNTFGDQASQLMGSSSQI